VAARAEALRLYDGAAEGNAVVVRLLLEQSNCWRSVAA
jgi:hypothetical protein